MQTSVPHIAQSVGKAELLTSKLPPNAPKIRHMLNNLVARPDTRLLHIGHNISYSIWGNEALLKAHWIDDDFERAPPRPDVYPYTVVTVDSVKMRSGVLRHHAGVLASEFIFCVDGWNSRETRRGVDREIHRLNKWDVILHAEIRDTNNQRGWENGMGIFVMHSLGIQNRESVS